MLIELEWRVHSAQLMNQWAANVSGVQGAILVMNKIFTCETTTRD
jgi:hypothetical protein